MNDVVALIARRMDEAAENMRTTTMFDPPFCDVDLHRPREPGLDISTCRDCGAVVVRDCPCCDTYVD